MVNVGSNEQDEAMCNPVQDCESVLVRCQKARITRLFSILSFKDAMIQPCERHTWPQRTLISLW